MGDTIPYAEDSGLYKRGERELRTSMHASIHYSVSD